MAKPALWTTFTTSSSTLAMTSGGEAIDALSVISALRKSTADFVQQDRAQEAPTKAPEEAAGSADAEAKDD